MPNYTRFGKIQRPITDSEFKDLMDKGKFVKDSHVGYVALLYYSAVRKGEALKSVKNDFMILDKRLIYDVGKRFKGSLTTPALEIPLSLPYVEKIRKCVEDTKENDDRVWPYCMKTGYNIVRRIYAYPHFFRLSRITNFFLQGWNIPQVRSWTGLSLNALNYYIGLVNISRMGDTLK